MKSFEKGKKLYFEEDYEAETQNLVTIANAVGGKKPRKPRGPKLFRDKNWWKFGYNNWSDEEFKKRLRVSRNTFELILQIVEPFIMKKVSHLNQEPSTMDRQLSTNIVSIGPWCLFFNCVRFFWCLNLSVIF